MICEDCQRHWLNSGNCTVLTDLLNYVALCCYVFATAGMADSFVCNVLLCIILLFTTTSGSLPSGMQLIVCIIIVYINFIYHAAVPYRSHYASCPSLCPSVPYGLVTRKQKT